MSMSLKDVKWESSSSLQREVIELMFTCEIVRSPFRFDELDAAVWCVSDEAADPSEAAPGPGSGENEMIPVRQRRCSGGWRFRTKH